MDARARCARAGAHVHGAPRKCELMSACNNCCGDNYSFMCCKAVKKKSVDAGFENCKHLNDVSPSSVTSCRIQRERCFLLDRNSVCMYYLQKYSYIAGSLLQVVSFLRIYIYIYPSVAGPLYVCVDQNSSNYRTSTNSHKKVCTGRDARPKLVLA
jgi:hypothetical protein